MADNGAHPTEVDPAAAFLAQQESEIAGIENDAGGFGALEGADGEQTSPPEPTPSNYDGFEDELAAVNGEMYQESNGPTDNYAAIAQVDTLRQEPESLRKWREEQKTRLEALDLASKAAEAEWRDKAKKELEDWHVHQSEQMEKNKVNNRASEEDFVAESNGESPGTEWERVARLCDFNPKTNKQAKDVSRMRSVLISLKQTPLVR
ncbi:clathrin light chain B isoform X3 [Gasterosteus aculeatus]|uniref:Clathrin light chain n=1 Tax=Gasterosteus aculeatus aculeatus TaxID=481459 RepID=A0AAQ4PZX3_GASAC|nr:clathrin light chain B isoform X5 [Gasterosteus aculeatus aculeatus]